MPRPTIPPNPKNFDDPKAMKDWTDAKSAAFLYDAQQAGFTADQAAFLLERYGAFVMGAAL